MKINEDVTNILLRNIDEKIYSGKCIIEQSSKYIHGATTVEEIMQYKKELILAILETLPLGIDNCYFCLNQMKKNEHGILNCDKCEYGKIHGICSEGNSDYKRLVDARDAMRTAINTYYKGEWYKEEVCKCCGQEIK
jgi:hypothetical protein